MLRSPSGEQGRFQPEPGGGRQRSERGHRRRRRFDGMSIPQHKERPAWAAAEPMNDGAMACRRDWAMLRRLRAGCHSKMSCWMPSACRTSTARRPALRGRSAQERKRRHAPPSMSRQTEAALPAVSLPDARSGWSGGSGSGTTASGPPDVGPSVGKFVVGSIEAALRCLHVFPGRAEQEGFRQHARRRKPDGQAGATAGDGVIAVDEQAPGPGHFQ